MKVENVLGSILMGVGIFAYIAFQAHQLFTFNTYWGYDGGAHLHIIESLHHGYSYPKSTDNYLAWHEPLYYVIIACVALIGIPYGLTHFAMVLLMDILIFTLYRKFGLSQCVALFTTLATLSLPAFLQVSMFLTNEVLNYIAILLLMHGAITLTNSTQPQFRNAVYYAGVLSFGMLTKITAIVAGGVIAIVLAGRAIAERNLRWSVIVVCAFVCAGILYLPWLSYRSASLQELSINNYEMLPARGFAIDERVHFFTTFDRDIFIFPFWYSGGRGLWSMLYADSVSDYLGIFENQDKKLALPDHERVLTTHNGNSVSAYRVPLAFWALRLGAVPIAILILGVGSALLELIRQAYALRIHATRQETLKRIVSSHALLVCGFFFAFLLALMYYAFRYPYPEQGVVKAIFIAPAIIPALAFGIRMLTKSPWWVWGTVCGMWAVYVGVVLKLFYIFPTV